MGRPHHHALQYRLSADERFFSALQRRQELKCRLKPQEFAQLGHVYWMTLQAYLAHSGFFKG
jgi:hypothetical protein